MESFLVIIVIIIAVFIVYKIFSALLKWVLIILVVVLAVAYFSNPDEHHHKNGLSKILKNFPVKVKDDAIQVDDYKVFSLTKVKVHGEEKIVGIGAFGKVWYFDDLKEKILN